MKGLVIRSPYIEDILDGKKDLKLEDPTLILEEQ